MGSWSDTPNKKVRPMDQEPSGRRGHLIRAMVLLIALMGYGVYLALT